MTTSTSIETNRPATGHDSEHTSLLAGYITSIAEEGERFALAAAAGGLDVPVSACPGWDIRELVKHVGLVHLWAAANIEYPSDRWLSVNDMSDLALYWPDHATGWPADADLVTWYRSTLTNLTDVLGTAPDDHHCLTFLPAPSPLIMWARRQASEIAVHRCDAEAARGRPSRFEPRFAADMLDELLTGFAPRMRPLDATNDCVLRVAAEDVGDHYVITMGPSGIRTEHHGDHHDLAISGSAADLYLLMWNRPKGPSIRLDGDARVLDLWRETCRIEWL